MKRIAEIMKKIFQRSGIWVIIWLFVLGLAIILFYLIVGYHSALNRISFLPGNTGKASSPISSAINHLNLKNPWYILLVDPKGRIVIKNLKGEVIISDLTYFADYVGKNEKWGLENVNVQKINDSTILITGKSSTDVLVNLVLQTHNYIPKLDVHIKTQYSDNTLVNREALVASFDVPVSEVYLKNRKIDKGNFEPEYWLNHEGASFGTNDRSAMIYHTSFISSMQLDTEKKLLFLNLEYYLDHPRVNYPHYPKGATRKWVDISKTNYSKGAERNNFFSINIGRIPKITPRLMSVPYGYKAGYVFTEHADGGDIRKQRAIYFGNEDITKATNAIGGFVGHKIPVTKSVFYIAYNGNLGSAIHENQKDSLLLNFLDQIYATGMYDICLHTPEDLTSNRKIMAEALKFMKNRYNTITWIDHGFDTGKYNREAMQADGLDTNSKNYSADLWEKYETRYFWTQAVENIKEIPGGYANNSKNESRFYNSSVNFWRNYLSLRELKSMSFLQALMEKFKRYSEGPKYKPYVSIKSNSYPTPLYWKLAAQNKPFYIWSTPVVKLYKDLSPKIIEIEERNLNKLVNNWEIFINHGYFVRNHVTTQNEIIIRNGKYVINPYFDKILGLMAEMYDKGDLYITTIRDLLDYEILLDNISFEYLPNGEINIINNNNKPIKGLSIVVMANKVLIDDNVPSMKHVGKDIIVWFDIAANSKVKMQVNK